MIRTSFRPGKRLLSLLFFLSLLLLVIRLFTDSVTSIYWLSALMTTALVLYCAIDWFRASFAIDLQLSRDIPPHLNLQQPVWVNLIVANNSAQQIDIMLQERLPPSWHAEPATACSVLNSAEKLKFRYQVTAVERGEFLLEGVDIRLVSHWGCWQCSWFVPLQDKVRVYPDFSRLLTSSGLIGVGSLPIAGLKQFTKRGSGTEFHQLREYRQGDSASQIDWQASSRRLKIISREYQEEQSQQVIVMLDGGQRMKIQTDAGSHFDTALSALLLLAHSVLKQGDSFSMQCFGASERWLSNVKGAQNISRIMQHFYDLYPSEVASDYLNAAKQLIARKPKRALVIIVTTLLDEDFTDLLPAIRLLQQHHLVALLHLENEAIAQAVRQPVNSLPQADKYFAAIQLQNSFRRNWQLLQKERVLCVASRAKDLLPQSLNVYLRVKRSGML